MKKKFKWSFILMAFFMIPLNSCHTIIVDEPTQQGTSSSSKKWMPDFKVHSAKVDFNEENYIYNNGLDNTVIYFKAASGGFSFFGATIAGFGPVTYVDNNSIEVNINSGTSFPGFISNYVKGRGYLLEATVCLLDRSQYPARYKECHDVSYYFYLYEINDKLYYSYQRIE